MKRNLIIAMLIWLGATTPAIALDCARTVSILGMGPSGGVSIVGDLALIGAGSAVVVFDASDPAHPRRLGETDFGGTVTPVGTIGDLALAFATDSSPARLLVIDPNPQGSPLEISSLALPESARPADLVVVGSTAWIVTWSAENGLLGVDLTDPHAPDLVQVLELPGSAESIAAVDTKILIVSQQVGLMIVDVTDPVEPSFIGSLDIRDAAAITANTEHAYIATFWNSGGSAILVVDLTDLSHLVTISSVPVPYLASPTDLAIVDDRLYFGLRDWDPSIGLPEGGFVVYDINDPAKPVEIDYAPFSSGPEGFALFGATIAAADHERGLRIFTEESEDLTEIARRNLTLDDAYSVAVEGDIAYLGDQGLRIIDISDHSHPLELGSVELEGDIIAVAAEGHGTRVAALAWGGELSLIDASNPALPVVRSALPTNGVDLSISGTIVAVAEGDQGVTLTDVTNLEAPTLVTRISTDHRALAVALDSNLAVIGLAVDSVVEGAVAIYDITDPADPILKSQQPTSNWVGAVDVADSKAAILIGDALRLIDISDPAAPIDLGTSDARLGIVEDIAIDGFLVHASSWSGSLQVIDFSDPDGPSLRARTTWDPFGIVDGGPQGGYGVAIHNGSAVIADGRYGLRLVSIASCRPVPRSQPVMIAVD